MELMVIDAAVDAGSSQRSSSSSLLLLLLLLFSSVTRSCFGKTEVKSTTLALQPVKPESKVILIVVIVVVVDAVVVNMS